METSRLGPFEGVSRLTLGGGGIGQLWGETTVDEALATVRAALESGITLIDTAPIYLGCEDVVASAFHGALPKGVRITSKCQLGAPAAGTALAQLGASLDISLTAMHLEQVDAFFLHSNICEDDTVYTHGHDRRDSFATPWSQYVDEVAPALASLKSSGRVAAWGITGVGVPSAILKALAHEVRPDLVQIVTNLLDSPGAMRRYAEAPRPTRAHRGRGRSRGRGDGDPRGPGRRADVGHRPDPERHAPRGGRLPTEPGPTGRCATSWARTPRCSRTATRSAWTASTPSCSG